MEALSSLLVPVILAGTALFAMGRKVDVYSALTHGAETGLTVMLRIIPALVGLLTAVYMFRASGAMELFGQAFAPVLELLGIPPETAPLLLIRPVSGSGALAVGTELMQQYGPDSYIGRVAAVRDHLLYHRRLLRLRRDHQDPLRHPRRSGGRPDGLCRCRADGAPVLRHLGKKSPRQKAEAPSIMQKPPGPAACIPPCRRRWTAARCASTDAAPR